jgi:hypothetical protein
MTLMASRDFYPDLPEAKRKSYAFGVCWTRYKKQRGKHV